MFHQGCNKCGEETEVGHTDEDLKYDWCDIDGVSHIKTPLFRIDVIGRDDDWWIWNPEFLSDKHVNPYETLDEAKKVAIASTREHLSDVLKGLPL